ncbi:MAG: phenylalanine--tRNA ligase subunit alpha [Lactobacillaceae bacterium]|jgi:phenylalanyl-tRNA synthetase alpha chain|nr:phenylalanine--tRNA ligase subunit alpha [Lactobacillaceae bacterium]
MANSLENSLNEAVPNGTIIEKVNQVKTDVFDIAPGLSIKGLDELRVEALGKKGVITSILKSLKDVPADQRKEVGAAANLVRNEIEALLDSRKSELEIEELNAQLEAEKLDVTRPGTQIKTGTKHVLQQIQDQIEDLFVSQGYQVVYGNEIETDEYNFERMNLPKDHPARDMQDTFYINPELLLRTQTSAMQARMMDVHDFETGPLKMISPGVVYRRDDDDATHSHQFHQVEGLVVGKNVTMADLKGTLLSLFENLFGKGHAMRFRPSYFPFTEPSIEVDVSWNIVDDTTKPEDIKWIEVLGAGMVHPNVLSMSGIDPQKYSGFAFGLGPDRFAMIKYGIDDIRNFYLDDVRFLEQFRQVNE